MSEIARCRCAVLLARGFESLYELINIRYGRDSFGGHGILAGR